MIKDMIDAIIDSILGTRNRKGFKMKVDPINTNYKYIHIVNKKLLLQNQRRY